MPLFDILDCVRLRMVDRRNANSPAFRRRLDCFSIIYRSHKEPPEERNLSSVLSVSSLKRFARSVKSGYLCTNEAKEQYQTQRKELTMWKCKCDSLLAVFVLLLALPCAATSHAQSSTPQETNMVLHVEVRRVPLDIVVTDQEGKSVRGLKKDDFLIKEDGRTQKPLTFDYLDRSSTTFVPPKLGALPANTFVNLPSGPEQGPLYVLYYDMVNTPTTQQMQFHKQLLDFVDHAQPGTRFALFANTAGLHLIQGFTSDHALLHAAILSQGPGPHLPKVFFDGRLYGYQDAGAVLSNMKFIAEYLLGIPGRKNLLWLSSEFPIPVGPAMNGHNSNAATIGGGFSNSTIQINDLTYLEREGIKGAYSAMEKSQVALYLVDLNGVGGLSGDPGHPGDLVTEYQHEDDIAAATGGRAYHGNNRVAELLDKAVDNGTSYYSLTYSPTNTKYDGSERHIEVTLAKKAGYTLSYRTLYYGVPDSQPVPAAHKSEMQQAHFVASKVADNLYANIEHGAPMLHDLLFSAHVTAEGAPVMATAEQMLQLEDSPVYFRTRRRDKPLKPLAPVKLQKYLIAYRVLDSQLKSTAKHKDAPPVLEFAAAVYDVDGRMLNSMLNEGMASPETDPGSKSGALFEGSQELEVPPGGASIRLAVRDKLNNRTGTLELQLPLKSGPILPGVGQGN